MNVDLAVIMSVYHNDKLSFVRESIQSILDQTFSRFHYYLIFDGPVSTDIDDYVASLKDNRIRLSRLEKNSGLATALNHLLEVVLKNSDYQYIARMDADDISMPERFEKQRNYLIENPEITVLGSWYEEIDEAGKHLSYRKLPTEHEALRKRYYTRTPFAHSSVMFHRRLIEIAGYYPTDTVLMEDNVLWGRALKNGLKFGNIAENLLKFRIDIDYYKRRSGIKYGWNFIKTRFKINRSLKFPAHTYIYSVLIGTIKMIPSFIYHFIYWITKRMDRFGEASFIQDTAPGA
jgi:glycosyltransferase involved in cell wall biosynthesis